MDRFLLSAIVEMGVIGFGPSQKNKNDSPSCLFDPRRLMSRPEVLEYVGSRIADIALREARGSALVAVATSGIAWASAASIKSRLPLMYVRKAIEEGVSGRLVEGRPPDDHRLILVDDLLFAGESKKRAIEILGNEGFEVTDVIVLIDRQLQRRKDGPALQQPHGLLLHSLVDMSDIVDFLLETGNISDAQLADLIADYRRFDRWLMPRFAVADERLLTTR